MHFSEIIGRIGDISSGRECEISYMSSGTTVIIINFVEVPFGNELAFSGV